MNVAAPVAAAWTAGAGQHESSRIEATASALIQRGARKEKKRTHAPAVVVHRRSVCRRGWRHRSPSPAAARGHSRQQQAHKPYDERHRPGGEEPTQNASVATAAAVAPADAAPAIAVVLAAAAAPEAVAVASAVKTAAGWPRLPARRGCRLFCRDTAARRCRRRRRCLFRRRRSCCRRFQTHAGDVPRNGPRRGPRQATSTAPRWSSYATPISSNRVSTAGRRRPPPQPL